MNLLHRVDGFAPWPEAGGDGLTFYRQMSAAYSQRLALAKQYIEQSEHRPGCMYSCTCGRDALLKAMTPDQPPPRHMTAEELRMVEGAFSGDDAP